MGATITITIKDDVDMSENAIYDIIENCVEYELYSANYEIDIDVD